MALQTVDHHQQHQLLWQLPAQPPSLLAVLHTPSLLVLADHLQVPEQVNLYKQLQIRF